LVYFAGGSVISVPVLGDLVVALKRGSGALDVFEDEPRVPEALFRMDNVILQPHQGSATHATRAAMGQLVVDNLKAHFAGTELLTPVV
jgi:lactate dehydrogenase-like 2-hydroxyacid dehydrogenase